VLYRGRVAGGLVTLVASVLVLAGCAASATATPSSTASPKVPATALPTASAVEPSNACGGFQFLVVNERAAAILVRMNGQDVVRVDGGTSLVITEFGVWKAPLMPWRVEIVDEDSSTVLATREVSHESGDGGATMDVKETGAGDVMPGSGC